MTDEPTITIKLAGTSFSINFEGEFPIPLLYAVSKLLERFATQQLDAMDYAKMQAKMQQETQIRSITGALQQERRGRRDA